MSLLVSFEQVGPALLPSALRGLPEPAACVDRLLCNRYLVEELCDETESSALYRAYHLGLDRQVLLEILPRRALGRVDALHAARRQASLVSSPRVRCLEVMTLRGQWPVFVHPYRKGISTTSFLRASGKMPFERILPLSQQIASAISAIHGVGSYHGSLSLDKIWLQDRQGHAEHLMVLGLGGDKLPASRFPRAASGVFARTAGEVALGAGLHEYRTRADIESIGRCLYQLSTGQSLPRGQVEDSGLRIELAGLQWNAHRAVERGFSRILRRCFAGSRETRYASLREFCFDLHRLECTARSLRQLPGSRLPPVTAIHSPARRRPAVRAPIPKVIVRQPLSA